jgi:hypothetical protein
MGAPKKKSAGTKVSPARKPNPVSLESTEDQADAEAARRVKSTGEKPIPWEQAEKELDALR